MSCTRNYKVSPFKENLRVTQQKIYDFSINPSFSVWCTGCNRCQDVLPHFTSLSIYLPYLLLPFHFTSPTCYFPFNLPPYLLLLFHSTSFREAAKKVLSLMAVPLRRGRAEGVRAVPLRKKIILFRMRIRF